VTGSEKPNIIALFEIPCYENFIVYVAKAMLWQSFSFKNSWSYSLTKYQQLVFGK